MKFFRENNYSLVLVAFVLLLIVPTLTEDRAYFLRQWNIFISISIIVSYFSILDSVKSKTRKTINLIICLIPVILNGIMFSMYTQSRLMQYTTLSFNILVLIIIITRSAQSIYRTKKFNLNIILASVTIYILLGLVGAFLFTILEVYDPKAISYPDNVSLINNNTLYFSFTTLTTLGYGDILPVTGLAQSLTILISVMGQLYLTILMAIIIGIFLHDLKRDEISKEA